MKLIPGMAEVLVNIYQGGLKVRIDDSVGWGVDRCVGSEVCRGVDGEVNMSKAE